jgi:hypothetical protein
MSAPVLRRVAGLVVALATVLVIAVLSRLPWSAPDSGRAVLRLSWRATGERVEECRSATAEELQRLPAHMRQERICEGRVAPFHLVVRVDGRTRLADTVRAGGARADRPIYVFRELTLDPGAHEVIVEFSMARPAGATSPDTSGRSFPPALALRTHVVSAPGEIVLVTYDADVRALVTRLPGD